MDAQHSTAARDAASNAKAVILSATISKFDQLPDSALIGSRDVREVIGGIGEVTLWRWVRKGEFPAPRKLPGGRLNAWKVADIRKFLAQEADHAPD